MRSSPYRKLWFLFGLGSSLQVLFSLSISEALAGICAIFWFSEEISHMRRTGMSVLLKISFLPLIGCVIACIANGTEIPYVLRGVATTGLIPCATIVSHRLFRKDMNGYKLYLIGVCLSTVLSTFIFQNYGEIQTYAEGKTGAEGAALLMSGPLYWIQRLSAFVRLPMLGWYLAVPLWVSVGTPLFMAIFALKTSASGRSAALCSIGAVAMILIGGKKPSTIRRVSKHLGILFVFGILVILCMNVLYRKAALSGWLGERSRVKYESQTRGGTGVIQVLIGGRADSFKGLLAVVDKPFTGFGPWALDTENYGERFIEKYGTAEDYEAHIKGKIAAFQAGKDRIRLIDCHACWLEFWIWYGFIGMLYWVYVLFVAIRYLKQDCAAVPQWYAWLASGVPAMLWMIFFAPFMSRFGVPLTVVAYMMVRAVRLGRIQLPFEMQQEIWKVEQK